MASSSSLSRSLMYHVFMSFRGEDVRQGFLSHVMKELKSKGIIPFLDNEMKRGQTIDDELKGAIKQSRVAVVMLSHNYASSGWCLDELVEIMKCREEYKQTVMTIFYEVDPSDVRKQTGDFGKAFDGTCVGKTEEVKQAWRQALKDVAGIAGYHSSNCGNEADLIKKVASDVTAVLGFTPSKDFDDFVGIRAHITEIKSKLSLQSEEEVKVIVVVGPAGIGKTTTARVLYNQFSPGFPFNTFLEDIRGSFEEPYGDNYQLKLRFQKKLLSEIFNQKDIQVGHLGVAQQMLGDKKVLVVLDEVDSWWQLEEMANKRGWFGPGSMLIITTEDRNLLKKLRLGTDHIYEMKLPTSTESLQIFCQYAFGQNSPDYGFELLAWEVTWLAGNLPLGLRVMGSYLRGMSKEEWIKAQPRLRSSLDREIVSTLRFSYEGLSDKDKAIFLHIACFFGYFKVDSVKNCFEKSGLDVSHGLEVLAGKSLISIDYGFIKMHSLLRQMGRDIVKKNSSEEPGEQQFFWDTTEISELLDGDNGTGKVKGIMLDTSEGGEIQISKDAFKGMNNLQFLRVYSDILKVSPNIPAVYSGTICIPEGLNCFPDKLRLIHWNDCPLRIWPNSKFSGKFLVELIMQDSKFEKLWEGIQPLQCLRLLDLSLSRYLKRIPDLSKAMSLQKLDLHDCESLLEITSSIGNATKLTVCKLNGCLLLKELPSSMSRLINLEELNLSSLKALSVFSILEQLTDTAIEEMPSSMSTWSCLYKLDISGCENLKKFPNVPNSIVVLELSGTGIEEVPSWIENLSRLSRLSMSGCKELKTISPNISKLENLEKLDMSGCENLTKFPNVPNSIVALELSGTGIDEVPSWIKNLSCLSRLSMSGCKELKTISPNISKLENLEFLGLCIYGFSEGDYIDQDCPGLFEAIINWGPDLKRIWRLRSDFDVHDIFPICLPEKAFTSPISLRFDGNGLKTIPDCIGRLSGLIKLDVSYCQNLVALPPLPGSLLSIDAQFCDSLKSIDSSFQNPNICLNFSDCCDLNQEARKFIQTSACKYAFLPGEEVPAHFTHRANSGSLTINVTSRSLPSSFRFKACILLSGDYDDDNEWLIWELFDNYEDDENLLMRVSCRGEQNGLTVSYGSNLHHMNQDLDGCENYLYTFEDSFCLNHDFPEAEKTTFSKLVFEFEVFYRKWRVKGCGVRLLEVPHYIPDGKEWA